MTGVSRILPAKVRPPETRVSALGIDLGTTNSTVAEAAWSPGAAGPTVECLAVEQELPGAGAQPGVLVPSFVALHVGETWVGEGARRLRAAEPGLQRNERIFWECKNDIGLERTYHRAPPGFRNAAEIAAHVLRFLSVAADEAVGDECEVTCVAAPPRRTVVTVPASFQAAQRLDTLEACRLAGLSVAPGELLDEPLAAFIDFLDRHGVEALGDEARERTLLVFDFGGGTCDVAVIRLSPPSPDRPLEAAPLAVSRYHRLGGGDIDAAILHEVLVPLLLAQNGLGPFDLSYADKVRSVTPALIHLAELLKISLCRELAHRRAFGSSGAADDLGDVQVTYPGVHEVRLKDGRTLRLETPTLTAGALDKLLIPFLDPDILVARDDEFRLTCSIFAPIEDALSRAHMSREALDACLLVGGSSLIPQVADAVRAYLPKARLFFETDPDLAQTAVARGAACHALALTLCGTGIVRPVTAESLSLRTTTGVRELVARGEPLPIPAEGWRELRLVVPEASVDEPVPLRVEVLNGAGEPVVSHEWPITPPVKRNEPLVLRYRLDENQALHMSLSLALHPDRGSFRCKRENPLTNVVNPQPMRLELARAEERLRAGERSPQLVSRTAELCTELGHFQKAFDFWKARLAMDGRPNAGLLNRMGILAERMKDVERAAKLYREAAAADPTGSIPLFNLALLHRSERRWGDARCEMERSLRLERGVPQLVLSAQIAAGEELAERRDADLDEALRNAGPLEALDDWELGWYSSGARMKGAVGALRAAEAERRRRIERPEVAPGPAEGVLPAEAPTLVRAS